MKLKKFASAASASFLYLIYHGAGTVVHLLLLKSSYDQVQSVNGQSYKRRSTIVVSDCFKIGDLIVQ